MASVVFNKDAETMDELHAKLNSVGSNSFTQEQRIQMYDEWAEHYDHDKEKAGTLNYKVVAEQLNKIVEDKRAKILDIGSGTGMHGKELRRLGYTQIDGIDPSESMVNVSRRDNVYDRYIVDSIDKHRLDIEDGTYDVITGSGVFGHINDDVFEELTRITKQEGLIFIAIHERFFVDEYEAFGAKFDSEIQANIDNNVWTLVTRMMLQGYLKNKAAHLIVVKKN